MTAESLPEGSPMPDVRPHRDAQTGLDYVLDGVAARPRI